MEVPHTSPNEALTPYILGEKVVWVYVYEYYIYDRHPELLIAKLALEEAMKKEAGND